MIYDHESTTNTFNYLLDYRWHTGFPNSKYGQLQLEEKIITLIDPQPGQRVLDFGCGNGVVTGDYAIMCPNVKFIGVSNIKRDLKFADKVNKQRKITNVTFIYSNGEFKINLPDNSVDHIVFTESVCHVKSRQKLFAEFKRLIKPGGKICGSDWFCRSGHIRNQIDCHYDTKLTTISGYDKIFRHLNLQRIYGLKFSSISKAVSGLELLNWLKYRRFSLSLPQINPENIKINKKLINAGKLINKAEKIGKFYIAVVCYKVN